MRIVSVFVIICSIFLLIGCGAKESEQPAPAPEPEPVQQTAPPEPEPVVPETKTTEILMLGKAGFDPLETTINAGDSVTFINTHDKDLTVAVFIERKPYENSPVIEPGEQWELVLGEPGEYPYWTVAFGPADAMITVQ